jgi:pheromone shutdown-related protein TraB
VTKETEETEEMEKMEETIRRVNLGERQFILVGTAHVSRESVEEVKRVIREEQPERVCLEIDPSRYSSLAEKNRWSNLDIARVLREGKGFLLLANLVLSAFQRRLGRELGVQPGEEMLAAIDVCRELGIPFSLCDRDIQITLRRAWARSGFWGKNKMLAALLASVFTTEKLKEEDIEKLKKTDALQGMMEELADYLPAVKEVLIDERDRYLATRLYQAEGRKVVAVVGAGHMDGIVRTLQALAGGQIDDRTAALEEIPRRRRPTRLLSWLIPLIIVGLMAAGFLKSGWQLGLSMIWRWFLVTGSLSALGALAALAHPFTILLAFVGAPITTLNPAVGIGLFTGYLEAMLRKPRVVDFERLPVDIVSLRGFFRNRITHILLVFFLSSVGGMLGTFIGIPYLSSLLA